MISFLFAHKIINTLLKEKNIQRNIKRQIVFRKLIKNQSMMAIANINHHLRIISLCKLLTSTKVTKS